MAVVVLEKVSPRILSDLRDAGSIHELEAGHKLFDQGQASHTVYLVLSGIVKLLLVSRNGGQSLLALRGVGELVGHYGALDGKPRAAAADSVVPSEVLGIAHTRFLELLRVHPELSLAIMAELSGQVREAAGHIAHLTDEQAGFLMARRLVQLAVEPKLAPLRNDAEEPIVIQSPFSQQDLAAWAGVSARSAAIALAGFRDNGLIRTGRLRIEIRDLNGLRIRAGLLKSRSTHH